LGERCANRRFNPDGSREKNAQGEGETPVEPQSVFDGVSKEISRGDKE
jgi:hypothetical protein